MARISVITGIAQTVSGINGHNAIAKSKKKIVLSANLIHCLDPFIFFIFCRISNWNVLTIGGTAALIFYSLGPIFVFCSMGKVSREKKGALS